jgi:hypothetical protein
VHADGCCRLPWQRAECRQWERRTRDPTKPIVALQYLMEPWKDGRTDAGHCARLLPAPVLLAPTHTDRSLHAFPLVRSKAWEAEGRAGARGAGSRCSAARCGASGAACCWYGQTPGIGRTVQGRQSSKGFRKARPRARGTPRPTTTSERPSGRATPPPARLSRSARCDGKQGNHICAFVAALPRLRWQNAAAPHQLKGKRGTHPLHV